MATVLLFLGMIAGLVLIPFGLPGAFIILACIWIYAFVTEFAVLSIIFLAVLSVFTLLAETADNWLTALGAKRYGATTGSIWLSILGGFGGAILIGGPSALLLGPLGPVAGGFIGAFVAVVAYELYSGKNRADALRAGWGTFLGRMAGIVLKLVIAIAMIIAVAAAILF